MVDFNVDGSLYMQALESIRPKKFKTAANRALKKSIKPIYDEYKKAVRKKIKSTHYPTLFKPLKLGSNKKTIGAYITIVSSKHRKDTKLRAFRLLIFEEGSKVRKTKKGYNRGVVKPLYIFTKIVKKKENQCLRSIKNNLCSELMDTWIKEKSLRRTKK